MMTDESEMGGPITGRDPLLEDLPAGCDQLLSSWINRTSSQYTRFEAKPDRPETSKFKTIKRSTGQPETYV
jgi:hypothetical protein